jgi:predicted restriction endonuclease
MDNYVWSSYQFVYQMNHTNFKRGFIKSACNFRPKISKNILSRQILLRARNAKFNGNLREEFSGTIYRDTTSVLSIHFMSFTIQYEKQNVKKYEIEVPF